MLLNAEAGQFRPQSWTYWHYRFGMAEPGHVPPMPVRPLGHRQSVDFDLFSHRPLSIERAVELLPELTSATMLVEAPDTAVFAIDDSADDADAVTLSLFGGIGFGRIGEPELTADGTLRVASADDLLATKLKVILRRIETKDYIGLAHLLRSGVDLARGLAAARILHGPAFQPSESLKAMTYFEGGDLPTLSEPDRSTLIRAVAAVGDIPDVQRAPGRLSSGET